VYSCGHSVALLRRRFSLPVSPKMTNDTLNLHGIGLCPTLRLIIKSSFLKCTILNLQRCKDDDMAPPKSNKPPKINKNSNKPPKLGFNLFKDDDMTPPKIRI